VVVDEQPRHSSAPIHLAPPRIKFGQKYFIPALFTPAAADSARINGFDQLRGSGEPGADCIGRGALPSTSETASFSNSNPSTQSFQELDLWRRRRGRPFFNPSREVGPIKGRAAASSALACPSWPTFSYAMANMA
jgi:hypothetical protein